MLRVDDEQMLQGAHTEDEDIHQTVDTRPFECALPTVLHELRLWTFRRNSIKDTIKSQQMTQGFGYTRTLTSEQHQSKAPLGVPQCATTQQDLLIVQWVFLASYR